MVRWYYYATPLFLVLEILFDIDIRVSPFIVDPIWRYGYYAFCFLCMIIIAAKPSFSFEVGIFECSVNLIVLFVGAASSWLFPFRISSTDETEIILSDNPPTAGGIIHFLVIGSVWILCFHRQVARLKDKR
jgi:hypothetical protein